MVFDYELLPSSRALTHMLNPPFPLHSSTFFRNEKMKTSRNIFTLRLQCLAHSPVWPVGAYSSIAYQRYGN